VLELGASGVKAGGLAWVLTLTAATSASAQSPAETAAATPTAIFEVEGRVVGPSGEPVPEAKLALASPEGRVVETTQTDQSGRFRIPDLPAGRFELAVSAEGFVSYAQGLDLSADVHELLLTLEAVGAASYHTLVQSQRAPLPSQDGTTTSTLSRRDIQQLPGGASKQLNDVVATGQGVTPDNFGAIHVRGNFAGLQLRVDGVQLPPAIQDRLQQLLEPQIVEEARVIVGGLPAEFGEDVAGVIDVTTRRAVGPLAGEAELLYGTYDHVEGQANAAGNLGPINAVIAGSLETTDRGLDPPAASPVLHDTLHDGRVFLRLEDKLSGSDRLELLAI
jgi:hypothetical protein